MREYRRSQTYSSCFDTAGLKQAKTFKQCAHGKNVHTLGW